MATNFLKSKSAWQAQPNPYKSAFRLFLPLVIGGGIVIGIIATLSVMLSGGVIGHALLGKDAITNAEKAVDRGDFVQAREQVSIAGQQFLDAQKTLSWLKFFRGVPYVGTRIVVADQFFTTGVATADALSELLDVGSSMYSALQFTAGATDISQNTPSASTLFRELTVEQKKQILVMLALRAPMILDAQKKITVALRSFDAAIANPAMNDFRSRLEPWRQKLVIAQDSLNAVLSLTTYGPALLGFGTQKNYLLFFQNNTELRPSGGFLGVYGTVTVSNGDMQNLETSDVYALDGPSEKFPRPSAPSPIKKYIGVSKWYLRDANWSPDFPTSAQTMEKLYREEYALAKGTPSPQIDGIIGVTPTVLQDLLTLTGPITIDTSTFTAKNVVDELEFQVEKGFSASGVPYVQRKDIVKKLFQALIDRLSALSLTQLQSVVELAKKNLIEGQIVFSFTDPTLQQYVLANDWGGQMRSVRDDYLSVIDANLASLKSDPVIQRSVNYQIKPVGSGYEGIVRLQYRNTGTFTWKTTRYRTYTRIYVPAGSTFLDASGAMENDKLKDPSRRQGHGDSGNELGRTVFGAFVSIEPGETKTLQFHFQLAQSIVQKICDGSYMLDVEKQLGTSANGLTVDLDFGKKLTGAAPPEKTSEFGDTHYRFMTDLRTDRTFTVSF